MINYKYSAETSFGTLKHSFQIHKIAKIANATYDPLIGYASDPSHLNFIKIFLAA